MYRVSSMRTYASSKHLSTGAFYPHSPVVMLIESTFTSTQIDKGHSRQALHFPRVL